ncbi:MAG: hypothetical protein HYY50_01165 [Candidatus Kerfeldbacteria bacterium]|nr:hypothetical protein [Candidatus Kerfeldbacteria bacterium]
MLLGWLRKLVIRLIKILVLPVLVVALVLGYYGFLPGVSKLFGSDRPRDLGVSVTAADLQSANSKLGQSQVALARGQDPHTIWQAADEVSVDANLTPAEYAAHFMTIHPVKDLQLLFHDDGSFEASGRIDRGRIRGLLRAAGVDEVDQLGVLSVFDRYLLGNPIFYLRGTGEITDGQASLTLEKTELGRLSLSPGPFAAGLVTYAEGLIKNIPHLTIARMAVENGRLHVQGTIPAVIPTY